MADTKTRKKIMPCVRSQNKDCYHIHRLERHHFLAENFLNLLLEALRLLSLARSSSWSYGLTVFKEEGWDAHSRGSSTLYSFGQLPIFVWTFTQKQRPPHRMTV